jgi:hypothetical protein
MDIVDLEIQTGSYRMSKFGCLLVGCKQNNSDAQRSGIAAGGEFIVRPARNRCPIENIKLKLTTKS